MDYVARSWHHQQYALQWRHNGCENVSNHQLHDCLLNRLFRRRSKKTSKFRVTGLCAGNSAGTGEFPAQMASNAENVSTWWRHRGLTTTMATHLSLQVFVNAILAIITTKGLEVTYSLKHGDVHKQLWTGTSFVHTNRFQVFALANADISPIGHLVTKFN